MRHKIQSLLVAVSLALPYGLMGQGTFQNLNFEASTVPPLANGQSGGSVSVSTAFPGWIAYRGTNSASMVFHNDYSIGSVSLSILGPTNSTRFEGNFMAVLQAGGLFSSLPVYAAALAQTGTLPAGIHTIMFYSGFTWPEVTFNGQVIPVVMLGSGVSSSGTSYEILGGDVGSFAGLSGELRFTSYAPLGQFGSLTYLDNIFFSTQPIPEPSTLSLFALGTFLFRHHSRRLTKS